MLEALLEKIGAMKVRYIKGEVVRYGQFGDYTAIESKTPQESLPELTPWAKEAGGFFYLVKTGVDIIGICLDVKDSGIYPGNGHTAAFKVRYGGWLNGRSIVKPHEIYVSTDNGLEKQRIDFYRGTIDSAFVKPIATR